jgi:hypothetical protein
MRLRLLFGAFVAVALVVAGCSPSSESGDSTASPTLGDDATTTSAVPTTAVPTTTTSSPTTTTVEATTEVALAHAGLIVGNETYYAGENGADPDSVITAVADALGPPTMDSGWGATSDLDGRVPGGSVGRQSDPRL